MIEEFNKDMIDAMKNKEKMRLTVIRMVKAQMKQEVIDRKREENDELLIDVVNKQIKMRRDSILEFEKANRSDLIEQTEEEIKVLEKYLPEQLSDDEVLDIITKAIADVDATSMKDMGKVMSEVNPKLKGRTDMKKVSEIVRGKLQ